MKSLPCLLSAILLFFGAARVSAIQKGVREKPQKTDLKPGEYVWEPEAETKGAIDIVIDLAAQKLFVYRDGVAIGRSTVSSGSKGRETPKSIYMIIEKNLTHHSNKYHEASMPFMERLTWGGLAIHAGNTPGHRESHGCVHVPLDFAKKLYELTQEGDSVLITDGATPPETTADPNLLFAVASDAQKVDAAVPAPDASPSPAPFVWKPEETPNGPVAIVLTSADKRVYVYRKGVEIGSADLTMMNGGSGPFGNAIYAALDQPAPEGAGAQWARLGAGAETAAPDLPSLAKSVTIPPEFCQKMRELIKPGVTLVITDTPANPAKPSSPD